VRTRRFQIALVAVLSITISSVCGLPQEVTNRAPPPFLLKAVETEIDLSPIGVTSNDCLVVLPSGAFRLQHRFQRLPSPSASRVVFEGQLSDADLNELTRLLNADEVARLPHFEYHPPSVSFDEIHAWVAQMARPSAIQEVGYYSWSSNTAPGLFWCCAGDSESLGREHVPSTPAAHRMVSPRRGVPDEAVRRREPNLRSCG
jgi:hypothetical protein